MINIRNIFQKFDPGASIEVVDKQLLAKVLSDPDFPFLISFPRTGSHWLRMLMELYFEKPSLVRVFYYKDNDNYLCYHHHDEDLKLVDKKNVIYLYRDPVDTVYSQLMYYKEDLSDTNRVDEWSTLYAKHLRKWLYEVDCDKKTVLTYEGLKSNMVSEFGKIVEHFEGSIDADRITAVAERVSKSSLKEKTAHDKQVVNLNSNYENDREKFRESMADHIKENTLALDSRLTDCFR